ncbi:hypothetical protein A2Z22_00500 [Candidatus Woesebacteria bacterium RBG_16_34_12]|uniref:Uncharacterized protein n=1 Tax=Candidatus Woesebacteria bacterium RBG_16_34_12 TaxID=1802480 RepID=A0A1F7XAZ1_9BACT|nr:MAG: hypothetical protein A2Z22_00500 [Candidatus Woesebacteria bacterium RBG_16_34_12]
MTERQLRIQKQRKRLWPQVSKVAGQWSKEEEHHPAPNNRVNIVAKDLPEKVNLNIDLEREVVSPREFIGFFGQIGVNIKNPVIEKRVQRLSGTEYFNYQLDLEIPSEKRQLNAEVETRLTFGIIHQIFHAIYNPENDPNKHVPPIEITALPKSATTT